MVRCSFDGCEMPHHAAGLCDSHYAQRKKGRELTPIAHRTSVLKWLREHVKNTGDECLVWPFSRSKGGYAQMRGGSAYRRMCELAHGKPPTPKHEAAHSCGKGHEGCVNPKHLRWATHSENIEDMRRHGTRLLGSDLPWAKLCEEDVLTIRALAQETPVKHIAAQYSVANSTIYDIINRKYWGHV